MTDRPVIFSGPMVRAILREIEHPGTGKTMTRRLETSPLAKCEVGDRLYVRESFHLDDDGDYEFPVFAADTEAVAALLNHRDAKPHHKKLRHAIHLPRAMSRLTLTVTAKKFEKLEQITDEDAKAEGAAYYPDIPLGPLHEKSPESVERWSMEEPRTTGDCLALPRFAFANYWIKLHGPLAWMENPRVVAISFTPSPLNIDAQETR